MKHPLSYFNLRLYVAVLAFPLILSSCSESVPYQLGPKLTINETKKILCSSDTTQSYVLYLPTSYNDKRSWPIILLFDAHANGKLAVDHLKEAGEIYGYILAGSNNSKNGLANTSEIAANMLNDISQKYKIDEKRIYAAGFSGGGRVALSFAAETGKLKGVITCGAGLGNFDPQLPIPKFDIYAIAGMEDFNYKEVSDIPQQLSNTGWRFAIDAFDGGHAWPPASQLKKAVLWFELNAMKDGLVPKNRKLVKRGYDSVESSVDTLLSEKRYMLALNQCQTGISFFSSLRTTKKLAKKAAEIEKLPGYAEETDKDMHIRYQEGELRKGYLDGFTTMDTTWWKNEIINLNQELANNKDLMFHQMLSRVKGFLGILCYTYTSGAIANNELDKAAKYVSIYQLVEPQNADCFFYKAILLDKKNKTEETVSALKKSLEYGFSDYSKIRNTFSDKVTEKLQL